MYTAYFKAIQNDICAFAIVVLYTSVYVVQRIKVRVYVSSFECLKEYVCVCKSVYELNCVCGYVCRSVCGCVWMHDVFAVGYSVTLPHGMQDTATHCTHCNTLQHAATHFTSKFAVIRESQSHTHTHTHTQSRAQTHAATRTEITHACARAHTHTHTHTHATLKHISLSCMMQFIYTCDMTYS